MKTTSELRSGSRVQHVQEMRRHASRFKEHGMSPPPIVVTKAAGSAAGPKVQARPPPVHARTLPNIRKLSIPTSIAVPSPNRQVPSRNAGYLHPFSAFERYFSFNGAMGSVHQRSCPTSPVNRSMTSGLAGGRAPELKLDTRCHDMDYDYIEIAMEVAEETARICDSPLPIPTDVPLVHSGLCFRTADDLNAWLMIRFNYTGHTRSLLDERWTPEFLARDIIQRSPDFGVTSRRSGVIPISLGSPCKIPAMSVPEEASHLPSEHLVDRSPLHEVPPRRVRMKKDLTIKLTESPVNTRFPHTPLWSSTPPAPPPSVPARRATKAHSLDHDVGAAEPRSGKKTGFVVGLLAVGALLGGSPSPTVPFDTPPHTAAHLCMLPTHLDLPHTPYSASGFGGWYGVPRETPSSAAHFLSPSELYSTGSGGEGYVWWSQSPPKERR